jgi:hypothetical protein
VNPAYRITDTNDFCHAWRKWAVRQASAVRLTERLGRRRRRASRPSASDLSDIWLRRAPRLLPALIMVLIVVLGPPRISGRTRFRCLAAGALALLCLTRQPPVANMASFS